MMVFFSKKGKNGKAASSKQLRPELQTFCKPIAPVISKFESLFRDALGMD